MKTALICAVFFAAILICSLIARRPAILEAFSPVIAVIALAGMLPVFGLMRISRRIRNGSFFDGKKPSEIIAFGQETAEYYNLYLRAGRSLFFPFRYRMK